MGGQREPSIGKAAFEVGFLSLAATGSSSIYTQNGQFVGESFCDVDVDQRDEKK
jgi:hypothetical protein